MNTFFSFLPAKPQRISYAPFDIQEAEFFIMDGFGNGTESPTVAGAESQDDTVIEITDGTMEKTVPVGANLRFAGDTQKYNVTSRALNATGTDEVQSMAANTATGGTFDLTFTSPSSGTASASTVTVTGLAFNATSAAVQTAVDSAFAGYALDNVTYTAGDITVAGGPANTTAITFTFDGASVSKRNWPMITVDGTNLTGGSEGAVTETAVGEKAGSTNSVTIDPALQIALSGSEAITFLPIELEIKVGTGNVTFDEAKPRIFVLNRGKLDSVKNDEEQPVAATISFTWEKLTGIAGATIATVKDALRGKNSASTWTTTNPDGCAPYCVDIQIRNDPDCNTGDSNQDVPEIITMKQFYYEAMRHDSSASLVTVEGRCNVTEVTEARTETY